MIYISHLIPDAEMEEFVPEAGIESIEFSISDNLDRLSETVRNYGERLKNMNASGLILHGPWLDINPAAYDSQVRRVTMLRFAQCYEAARELGAKKIVYHSGMNPYIYYEQGWPDQVAGFFSEFLQDRQDIEVVMENVFDRSWNLMVDVMKQVNQPNFKLCLDIGHAHCYSTKDVKDWARELAPYVTHVHVHDNCGDRDAHLGLGNGNLPWEEVLKTLPQSESRSWTIECNKKENILLCLDNIKKLEEIHE